MTGKRNQSAAADPTKSSISQILIAAASSFTVVAHSCGARCSARGSYLTDLLSRSAPFA